MENVENHKMLSDKITWFYQANAQCIKYDAESSSVRKELQIVQFNSAIKDIALKNMSISK